MAQDHEGFVELVQRLEVAARRQPDAYRRRVVLLAAMGYAYILLMLASSIGLAAWVCWHEFSSLEHANFGLLQGDVLLLGFAAAILQSLRVTFGMPQGLELRRDEAPTLFQMVDEVAAQLDSGAVHHLLVSHDFNAAVVQRPRFGVLGWQENYVLIGLPLMMALTPEQLRAVLAHELGHLSGNHSRLSAWIYRIRQTWTQIQRNLQRRRSRSGILFEWFLRWYAPFFSAYSFVLARTNEFVADRCAVEAAGLQPAADALVALEIKGRYLDRSFWPDIQKQADEHDTPNVNPYSALLPMLRSQPEPAVAATWIEELLRVKTGYSDTHPALAERLCALGYLAEVAPGHGANEVVPAPPPPVPPTVTAAEALLGTALPPLIDTMDYAWQAAITPWWRRRHRAAIAARDNLARLETEANQEPLTDEEAWQRVQWTREFKGDDAALPLLHELLARQPEHAAANYNLGQILLDAGDDAGIVFIERSMAKADDAVVPGCETIYGFLNGLGREDEATDYRIRALRHLEMQQAAKQERVRLTPRDKIHPHQLSAEAVESLRQQLGLNPQVGAAYAISKEIPQTPSKPHHMLVIARRRKWFKIESDEAGSRLLQQLLRELKLPERMTLHVLGTDSQSASNWRRVRRVPGAQIYDCKRPTQ